jgi:hypothetical protein
VIYLYIYAISLIKKAAAYKGGFINPLLDSRRDRHMQPLSKEFVMITFSVIVSLIERPIIEKANGNRRNGRDNKKGKYDKN